MYVLIPKNDFDSCVIGLFRTTDDAAKYAKEHELVQSHRLCFLSVKQ